MNEQRLQKTDLVWAAVFESIVAAAGLGLLLGFGDGTGLEVGLGIDLVLGWTLAVTAVVALLTWPGAGKALLVFGRVLVWLAFATLAIAAGLGSLSLAGVG